MDHNTTCTSVSWVFSISLPDWHSRDTSLATRFRKKQFVATTVEEVHIFIYVTCICIYIRFPYQIRFAHCILMANLDDSPIQMHTQETLCSIIYKVTIIEITNNLSDSCRLLLKWVRNPLTTSKFKVSRHIPMDSGSIDQFVTSVRAVLCHSNWFCQYIAATFTEFDDQPK